MFSSRTSYFNPWRMAIAFAIVATLGIWVMMSAFDSQRNLQHSPQSEPETIEVCIAAMDLPAGTTFSRDDVAKALLCQRVLKDSVPDMVVVDESLLYDMRLTQPLRKGEPFNSSDLVRGGPLGIRVGKCLISVPCKVPHTQRTIVCGDWINVHAIIHDGNKQESVLLACDVVVVAINELAIYDPSGAYCQWTVVVDRDTEALIKLARTRGCKYSVQYSDPVHPFDLEPVDIDRARKFLESFPVKPPPTEL